MKIRDVQKKDKKALEGLYFQLTGKEIEVDPTVLQEDTSCFCRVMEKDGEVIGTASLIVYRIPVKGLIGRVEDVVIDESARGGGLGRMIMDDLLNLAQEKGLAYLNLTSNPKRIPARRLYESLGFEIYDTGVFWKKMD
ncbi:MAG: GNAT family N-acetyltransferase [Candidatus Moranbacteria bacterium]|nr:GNAT family N-acetyltransferase [Candidatus Moranbacteria bacterium]